MTIATKKEKLHGYIDAADEKQLMAIYELCEDGPAAVGDWSEDEEFVAELNGRVKRWKEGIDPGFSIEEVKTSLGQMKNERFLGQ